MDYVVEATAPEVESESTFDSVIDELDFTGHAAELLCASYDETCGELTATFQVAARKEQDAIRYVADAMKEPMEKAGLSRLHYTVERLKPSAYGFALMLAPMLFIAAGCVPSK